MYRVHTKEFLIEHVLILLPDPVLTVKLYSVEARAELYPLKGAPKALWLSARKPEHVCAGVLVSPLPGHLEHRKYW
jgi:hypothetical protein